MTGVSATALFRNDFSSYSSLHFFFRFRNTKYISLYILLLPLELNANEIKWRFFFCEDSVAGVTTLKILSRFAGNPFFGLTYKCTFATNIFATQRFRLIETERAMYIAYLPYYYALNSMAFCQSYESFEFLNSMCVECTMCTVYETIKIYNSTLFAQCVLCFKIIQIVRQFTNGSSHSFHVH